MESRRDFDSMKRDTLTSTQAAAELNIDVSRVLQLCRAGRLGHSRPKHGKAWVITWTEINAYRTEGPLPSGRPKKK